MMQNITSTDLLEARELVEQHAQHHLVGLGGQVGQEQDLVWRSVVHSTLVSHRPASSGAGLGLL